MDTVLENQQVSPLPAGYTTRSGNIDDYKIAYDLLNAHSQHLNGCNDLNNPELLRLDWQNDGFNPETDVRMIFAPDHCLVGFAECWLNSAPPVHPWIFGCVHPAHWGKGVGSHILTWASMKKSCVQGGNWQWSP
jgi:hypothetical protein